MLRTFTIDLADAPQRLEDKIEQTEAAKEELLSTVAEQFPEHGFHDEECPPAYEDKFYELHDQRTEYEATKRRIEAFTGEGEGDGGGGGGESGDGDGQGAAGWDHYRFTFSEPSTTDALYIQGRSQQAAEQAQQQGKPIDGEMYGLVEMLDRLREDAPEDAPEDLAGGLPSRVGQWLLSRLEREATGGVAEDMGNPSPQEALNKYKRSRQG